MLVESGIVIESTVLPLRGFELDGMISAGDACPEEEPMSGSVS